MLELKNITKSYLTGIDATEVLHGVDCTIHDGEFVAIMGPSGSGKSTLMNIIGLLDESTSGTYHMDGQLVEKLTQNEQSIIRGHKIGFIFQGYNLISRMNILEQVMLPLSYQ